ncbi:unnamed protein product [Mycena citricolor]|uniref:C2H2-type domain-containing protein n=1 Tax=Mycena citricolor TaxID=2018698 RepID=A0AAD2HBH0_9AGAR|nr:unnamed protein product [Mycena citricolor]
MLKARTFKPRNLPCPIPGCGKFFLNKSGVSNHVNAKHPQFHPRTPSPDSDGQPCDRYGNFLLPNTPQAPPPRDHPSADDFAPYANQHDFVLADLLYRRIQMSAGEIDELMQNWAARPGARDPPFVDHKDLYNTIDATELEHVPWQSFSVQYNRPIVPGDTTPWKSQEYIIHFRDPRLVLRNQLANPDFKGEMDFTPKRVFGEGDSREYEDFMSGNWAWRQADIIADDPATHGSTFVPVILGSDKTTVSVATGQNEYYPLYLSNGLVHNGVRRAHRNAVTLIGFLAIPKTDRENQGSDEFRTFRRNLFHASLSHILQSLKPAMTVPEVAFFGDGHYRRVVYGLGPYIADYPEQVLLACVVQGWCTASNKDLDGPGGRRSQAHTELLFQALDHTGMWDDYGVIPDVLPFTWDFPRADIHELLSPDLLHQVIKGTFKDHLVAWVGEYFESEHGKKKAAKIMADIDRRQVLIAAVPPFPGLRRFPEGRGFKQWTGDDSKALMKVYLPAIEGHVPPQMVRAFSAFLDFCYLVRRNIINEATLVEIDTALARYHTERIIFLESDVCPNGFCLPRQHSLTHYRYLIQEFGAPNGLCSSITESKHIKAVKEPWRRSSRYQALSQMLTINDRLDKLAAARVNFVDRGMMADPSARPLAPIPSVLAGRQDDDDDDGGPSDDRVILGEVVLAKTHIRSYPRNPDALAHFLHLPQLVPLIRRFLYAQLHPDRDLDIPLSDISLDNCPDAPDRVRVFPSAVAKFFAPSDQSGIAGMLKERIRAVRSWRGGPPRYDCIFVEGNPELPGFRGLLAARVLLFFSFIHRRVVYPCALVTWFSAIGDEPCPDVGMWMVEPDVDNNGKRVMDIIHVDTILRGAHLIGISGHHHLPRHFKYSDSLDRFRAFYINKYTDHHAHEIAF